MRRYILTVVCLCSLFIGAQAQDLVILHTNDTHSQIVPQTAGENAGLGGYERREEYIKSVRAEHKNVLLLDAGDFSQGTPYFTIFGGKVEMELMNALEYDAACVGNHELDNGEKQLAERVDMANFPILCANYNFSSDSPLYNKVKPYTIIDKGGIKVGIIGITLDLNGYVFSGNIEGMEYVHPYNVVNTLAKELKEEKDCNLVIVLSHVGYNNGRESNPTDDMIAANSQNVDIIVGGHSHTFIDKPLIVKNKEGKEVIVLQADEKGNIVGRLDVNL